MGYKKLSNEQEKELIEKYKNGTPVKQLMLEYGFSTKKSISDKIKKHYPNEYKKIIKLSKQKRKGYEYHLNLISSPFDAYLIGLLLTDGYILSDRDGFGIDLTDEDVIKFISKTLNKSYKVYYHDGAKPRYRFIFEQQGITKELERYGVIKNKSYIIPEPHILKEEEQFIPYIIRGIIDGDGCVSPTNYGGAQFYIVSMSESFINWIESILSEKFFMSDLRKTQQENGIWKIETSNQLNILKLIAIVYNQPFGMSRKYNKLRRTFRDHNEDILLDKDDGMVQTTTEMA